MFINPRSRCLSARGEEVPTTQLPIEERGGYQGVKPIRTKVGTYGLF